MTQATIYKKHMFIPVNVISPLMVWLKKLAHLLII